MPKIKIDRRIKKKKHCISQSGGKQEKLTTLPVLNLGRESFRPISAVGSAFIPHSEQVNNYMYKTGSQLYDTHATNNGWVPSTTSGLAALHATTHCLSPTHPMRDSLHKGQL